VPKLSQSTSRFLEAIGSNVIQIGVRVERWSPQALAIETRSFNNFRFCYQQQSRTEYVGRFDTKAELPKHAIREMRLIEGHDDICNVG